MAFSLCCKSVSPMSLLSIFLQDLEALFYFLFVKEVKVARCSAIDHIIQEPLQGSPDLVAESLYTDQ